MFEKRRLPPVNTVLTKRTGNYGWGSRSSVQGWKVVKTRQGPFVKIDALCFPVSLRSGRINKRAEISECLARRIMTDGFPYIIRRNLFFLFSASILGMEISSGIRDGVFARCTEYNQER